MIGSSIFGVLEEAGRLQFDAGTFRLDLAGTVALRARPAILNSGRAELCAARYN
jgi:hypothetical protein